MHSGIQTSGSQRVLLEKITKCMLERMMDEPENKVVTRLSHSNVTC